MTNTNSYDCSYEKPLLESIMDILRFMDGWTKNVNNTNATKFATFQISKLIRYMFRNLTNYICSYLTKL